MALLAELEPAVTRTSKTGRLPLRTREHWSYTCPANAHLCSPDISTRLERSKSPCVGLEVMCFSSGLTPLMVGSNPADVNRCPERVVPLCHPGGVNRGGPRLGKCGPSMQGGAPEPLPSGPSALQCPRLSTGFLSHRMPPVRTANFWGRLAAAPAPTVGGCHGVSYLWGGLIKG